MCPTFEVHNSVYFVTSNAKYFCEKALRDPQISTVPDNSYLCVRQLVGTLPLSAVMCSIAHPIYHVLLMCTPIEIIKRINQTSFWAMTCFHVGWLWAGKSFKDKTTNGDFIAFIIAIKVYAVATEINGGGLFLKATFVQRINSAVVFSIVSWKIWDWFYHGNNIMKEF